MLARYSRWRRWLRHGSARVARGRSYTGFAVLAGGSIGREACCSLAAPAASNPVDTPKLSSFSYLQDL